MCCGYIFLHPLVILIVKIKWNKLYCLKLGQGMRESVKMFAFDLVGIY